LISPPLKRSIKACSSIVHACASGHWQDSGHARDGAVELHAGGIGGAAQFAA
jgi:hypothetical protein